MDVTFFQCPQCDLFMSRLKNVTPPDDPTVTEWQCWDCGFMFGIIMDEESLDLGLTNPSPSNDFVVFYETFESRMLAPWT